MGTDGGWTTSRLPGLRGEGAAMTNENNAGRRTRRDFVKTSALVAGAGLAAAQVGLSGSSILSAAAGQSQAGGSPANKFLGYVAFQDENRIAMFTLDKATG